MRRTVLDFSVRTDANISLAAMRKLVEDALGHELTEGCHHGMPLLKTELLGMQVLLSQWRGVAGRATFQLHGVVDDPRFLGESNDDIGVEGTSINQAIIDLLAVRGAGEWRVPSRAEIDAEVAYEEELRRLFATLDDDSEHA